MTTTTSYVKSTEFVDMKATFKRLHDQGTLITCEPGPLFDLCRLIEVQAAILDDRKSK